MAKAHDGRQHSVEGRLPFRRRLGRTMTAVLWFRIEDGWIYYLVLAGYTALVIAGIWLLTRHGWLPILAGFVVLLDGMTTLLILLHRWLTRRLRASDRPEAAR